MNEESNLILNVKLKIMNFDISKLIDLVVLYAPKVVAAILLWMVGSWAISKIVNFFGNMMQKRNVDESLRPFLKSLAGILLKVLLFITIAGVLGIDTTAFAAVIAAMGLAIGMALQGSLGNFAGGVLILLFKPFKVGDLIAAQGFTGVVEEIQAFSTKLVTPDNKTIILANGPLSAAPIENISTKGEIRVDMTYGISYNDDIDKAKQVIRQVIDACPNVLKNKQHDVFVSELGDSSVNFTVRPWAKSEHYWDVYFYMHENIKKAFDKNEIGIPYPTMELNMNQN